MRKLQRFFVESNGEGNYNLYGVFEGELGRGEFVGVLRGGCECIDVRNTVLQAPALVQLRDAGMLEGGNAGRALVKRNYSAGISSWCTSMARWLKQI